MNPHKAPGPDGLNAFFFQKHWDTFGNDVCGVVLAILEGHAISPRLNQTLVALIPKKPNPSVMTEFRPISLCSVLYKMVTEVISNKLKSWLPSIISCTQSALPREDRLQTTPLLHCLLYTSPSPRD